LGIASSVARLDNGSLITLPATPVAGKVLMIAAGNPGNGEVTLLPTVASNANSITAMLTALDGSAVATLRSEGSGRTDSDIVMFVMGIESSRLIPDFDTGYRPGVDDWDFESMALAKLPFLAIPKLMGELPVPIVHDGIVATSLWYYANRRPSGPPLNGSQQLLTGQPLSSRYGIRWAALADVDMPNFNQTGSLITTKWRDVFTDDPVYFSRLQFLGIKALMVLTRKLPVPVVLLETTNPDDFNADYAMLALAYRTSGNSIALTTPLSPGVTYTATFPEGAVMTPFVVTAPTGATITVRALAGIHYANVVDDDKMAAQWTRVVSKTIGDAEGWPKPTWHWEKAALDTAKVYLLDPLQQWWQCLQCPEPRPSPPQLPATASHVQQFQGTSIDDGVGGELSAKFASVSFNAKDTFEEGEVLDRNGFVLFHAFDAGAGIAGGWLDWQTVVFRKLTLAPSVDEITFSKDTTINVTVVPSEAPPAGTRYRWKLRTEDGQDSVETTTPTHTRELEAGADGWLIITALEGEHKRPIARDSIRIEPGGAAPYWRITSFTGDANFLEDDPEEPNPPELNAMLRVFGTPTAGLIAIEEVGGVSELRLRARRNAIWDGESCCPPAAYDPATEWLLPLGHSVVRNHPVGPFFGGWGTSFWSQSSQDLGAGSMTGQWVQSTVPYQIPDQGTQSGPDGGVRFTATRNGTTMTGQIVVWAWAVDSETGEVEEVLSYVYQFTAIRMQ
jgi:hypothetical protein